MTSPWTVDPDESLLAPYYHAIGVLTCRWHEAEQEFYFLAAQQAGILGTTGFAMLTHVGSETIANSLRALARHQAPSEEIRDDIIDLCANFGVHRENRNLFAHIGLKPYRTHDDNRDIALALKMTARSEVKQAIIEIELADIQLAADEILEFKLYLQSFRSALEDLALKRPIALPHRPARPRGRNQSLPQSLLSVLLQP